MFINKLASKAISDPDISIGITEREVIKNFVEDLNFPFLVSFPRTGSHWLRMIMELYFEKPSLIRVFYYKDCKDYLTLHTHDMDLDVYRKNVIYLYREPVATIYSQMRYYNEDINDRRRISHWSICYGRHLSKWLIEETESEKKTILRYENLVKDIVLEFSKITEHFGLPLNSDKLKQISKQVSKQEVKKKTTHDDQVINSRALYEENRQNFIQKYSTLITDLVLAQNLTLENYF